MRCPNCGQEIETNSKFCPECGAPQTRPEQAPQPAAEARPEQAPQPALPAEKPVSPAGPVPPSQEKLRTERAAYVRQDYDPARDGRPVAATQPYVQPSQTSSQPPQAYGQPPQAYGQPPQAYGQPSQAFGQQRPSTTGIIVFSIINMLCCGLGIGFILGVIALIFGIMAAGEINLDEARRKISLARTLNLIGLVFIILQAIAFFVFFGAVLLATRS